MKITETFNRHPVPPWMGWIIIFVAVLSTASMAWATYQQRSDTYRQRQCNEAIQVHLVNRARWADEDRRALQRLIVSVFENDRDPVQFEAYQDWLQVTDRNDRRRAAVSLPDLAECG